MKITPQQRQRQKLAAELASIDADIADNDYNLEQIDIHLRRHFAGVIGWVDWNALANLGGLTGCDTDHGNGRYSRGIVRNLKHHRAQLHLHRHTLARTRGVWQRYLDALTVTLPGFEHVDAEREAAQLTHILTQPIAHISGAKPMPLFNQSTQGSLF